MQIAVIGAGNIGGTLAKKWVGAGHRVKLGVRDPEAARVRDLVNEIGQGASAERMEGAVRGAEAVLFALPGAAMGEALAILAKELGGKIVIDATNNMAPGGQLNSVDQLAAQAPSALVFRAFNTLGWENFANPSFGSMQADLFYCGPSGAARNVVEQLVEDVGLRPIYVGGIDRVAVVDGIASLWFALVFGQKMPRHTAFKVLGD